jgi:hypothetical protein
LVALFHPFAPRSLLRENKATTTSSQISSDPSSIVSRAQSDNILTSSLGPSLDMMQVDPEGFEAFGFLTSELFDTSLFQGFDMAATGISPGV